MRRLLFIVCSILFVQATYAQTFTEIGSGVMVYNSGVAYNVPWGTFENDGQYIDTSSPGSFNVDGGVTFQGSSLITYAYDLNFETGGGGSSTIGLPITVWHVATINSTVSVDASGFDFILHSGASIVNNGILTGQVQGLVTKSTVMPTHPCPSYTSTLTINASGSSMLYQWQSSTDNSTWTDVGGANSASYVATVSTPIYYRCHLTANNSSYDQATPSAYLTFPTLPSVYNVTGGGSYCSGGTGVHIYLDNSDNTAELATQYQLYDNGSPIGSPIEGTGVGLDFGSQTAAGTYSVLAVSEVSGCTSAMTNTVSVTVNPLPANITGPDQVCIGLTIGLSDATAGGTWSSSNTSILNIGSTSGIVAGVAAGTANITYSAGTGCTISTSMTVLAAPSAIAGVSGTICPESSLALSDATTGGAWSSSSTSVATVDGSGMVYGVDGGGSATIAYTAANGCVATTPIAVVHYGGTGNWAVIGTAGFSADEADYTSIALDGSGTPYVAYEDFGNSYKATVMKYNGSSWVTVGSAGFSAAPVDYTSLAIDGSGTPYVAYVDIANGNRATVMKYSSGSWSVVGSAGFSAGPADFTFLALDGSGTPFVAYRDYGNSDKATVMKYDGSSWVTVGSAGFSAGTVGYVSLALDGSTPYVAYQDYANSYKATVMKYDGSSWVTVGSAGFSAGQAGYTSLALDGSTPYVAYTDYGNSNKATVMKYNGSSWVTVGSAGFSAGGASYTSLALHGSTPYVAFLDFANSYKATVMKYDGSSWVTVGSAGFSVGEADWTSLALNGSGTPYLAYSDYGNSYKATVQQLSAASTPINITGANTVCNGSTLALSDATTGGAWSSNNTSIATVDAATGVVTGVNPGNVVISYALTGGCTPTTTITVGAPPAITGTLSACNGATAQLSDAVNGGTWSSSNASVATIGSLNGLVTTVGTGTTTITYTTSASCASTAIFTVNSAATIPIAGTTTVCAGSTTQLSDGTGGGTWSSSDNSLATVGLTTGLVTGVATGTPLITYTLPGGCTATATLTVNALPTVYAMTGGGSFCAGGSAAVGLGNSQSGVNYTLYKDGVATATVVAGTGSAITFGAQTVSGSYTAVGTNTLTLCSSNMSGAVTVTSNALPTAFNVTGGGSYCSGGTGVHVGLDNSTSGINYQLYNGSSTVGSPVAGTGFALDFGLQTAAGTYSVTAINGTTTCTNGMTGSATISTTTTPAISGTATVCAGGSTTQLSDATAGGTWSSSDGSLATVGLTSGLVTGVSTGTPVITYSLSGGCTVTATVTVNALPTAYAMTGGGSFCAGGSASVGLGNSQSGVNYTLYKDGVATANVVAGTGSAITFGPQTLSGSYTAVGTNTLTLCSSNMSGAVTVTSNALPTAFNVTGGGSYCSGGTGVHVGLDNSTTGINYQLYNGSSTVGSPVAGTGFAIDFGLQTAAGTYSVNAINGTTTCTNGMTGSATISTTTTPAISGTATVCAGGSTTQLSDATAGGTWSSSDGSLATVGLTSGLVTGVSTGTPVITYSLSGGCTVTATVTVNALPTAYAMTGGGAFCAGGSVAVGLGNSQSGVNYTLYKDGVATATVVAGTGSAITFGAQTLSGSYTAVGTNTLTLCSSNMTGAVTVTSNALPTAFNVTGGGSYCSGGTGVHVGLDNSTTGINYQLYNGSSTVGSPVAGTGFAIDFGLQTAAGTYSVNAINGTTTCTNGMTGSATISTTTTPAIAGTTTVCTGSTTQLSDATAGGTWSSSDNTLATVGLTTGYVSAVSAGSPLITYTLPGGCAATATLTINALPVAYNMTGGGGYCAGGTGVPVGLDNSQTGVNYQLYRDGTSTGSPVAGTGFAISFGLQTLAGNYTAIATNTVTACTSNMNGSVDLTVNSLPTAYNVTGGGNYCTGGTGVHVGLDNSNLGINYQLYNGSSIVGSPVAGTGFAIDFGLETATGTYSVSAINTSTGCTNGMTGGKTITTTATSPIAGTFSVCAGSTAQLSDATAGGTWSSSSNALATVGLTSGLVSGVATGTPLISYSLTGGCIVTATMTVQSLPAAYNVTGGGSYCSGGSGVTIGLSGSESGISYELYRSGTGILPAVPGTDFAISFGSHVLAGNYTVIATNTVTACASNMTGSTDVTINPLPTAYNVTGGGTYCTGGTGLHIGLDNSASGVNYQLFNGSSTVGSPIAGTTYAIDFGLQTATGTYSVSAIDATTGCTNGMTGGQTITTIATPAVAGTFTVCAGSTTQLSDGTAGGTWSSSDNSLATVGLTSGLVTGVTAGTPLITYSLSGGCSTTATLTVNAIPLAYNMTGGGGYCSGGTGVAVGLDNSQSGVSYQLYKDGVSTGSAVPGTGFAITFGSQMGAGNYTAIATNTVTACTSNMTGSVDVTINPLPVAYNVTGGGSYCSGGTGVDVALDNSESGVNYQLYNGSSIVGTPIAGTGFAIDFGLQTTGGTYSVSAVNTTTGCANGMTGGKTVTVNPLPNDITGTTSVCKGLTTNLSDNTGAGVWNSGNTSVATVNGTGVVGGVGAGTANITFTLNSTGCMTATTVTVNPLPFLITGATSVCAGSMAAVSDETTGGTWSSSNTAFATVNAGSGVVTGVAAGTPTITYKLSTGCIATTSLSVNPLPSNITGTNTVCQGFTTSLSDATGGGVWSGNDNSVATIDPTTGVVTGVNPGVMTVTYQLTATGCSISRLVTVYTQPSGITGIGQVCESATTSLSDVSSGGTWSSSNASLATVDQSTGLVYAISAGMPTITYSLADGCIATDNITVNALPVVYTMTGGGSYCAGGTGVDIGMNSSDGGNVIYQLKLGSIDMGSPVAGTTAPIDFGLQTAAGTYTVLATNTSTLCFVGMSGAETVSVNALPAVYSITGGGDYCSGGSGVHIGLSGSAIGTTYQLYNGAFSVGSAVNGTGLILDFGAQTAAGNYYVIASNGTCTDTMTGTTAVTIDPLPIAYSIYGGGSYCVGSGGVHVNLASSQLGVNYTLVRDGTIVSLIPGTGFPLDFGLQTDSGAYIVSAINTTTSCTNNMLGTVTVTPNAKPVAYTVTGGGSYCSGGTGVDVALSNSETGVNYQLYNNGTAVGSPLAGTGHAIDFGMLTAAGTYTVSAVNATTGCTNSMSGSAVVTVNPLPGVYAMSGGGHYCAGGTGVHVGLSFAATGVNYTLYENGSATGLTLSGAGAALDFGLQTDAATYTALATDATTGCTSNMSGTAVVAVDPLPVVFAVTGGGSYCSGGAGVHIGLNGSTSGVNYQLYRGVSTVGTPVVGTGAALDFGLQTTAGNYTVKAVNATTGCTNNMSSSATVTINTLPLTYNVTGGGSYCAGGSGVAVGLSASDAGVSYQLYNGISTVGLPVTGTGGTINFGNQTSGGAYTVMATNGTCSVTMTGSATVTVNPLPTAYTVTGGGSYCLGGTGYHVGLAGSDFGISYQLLNGSSPVGSPVAGTGFALDFGIQTAGGTYVVSAINTSTSCSNNMSGSAVITVNTPPTAYAVTGGGSYCSGGSGVHVGLANSTIGVNYQLYLGSTAVGSPVAGTGFALDFGLETAAGTYSVSAVNTSTTCSGGMTGSVTVSINPLPTAYNVTGGGGYCPGGSGVHVYLSGSDAGISYQLYVGAAPTGTALAGSGGSLDFGLQTAAGNYAVVATNLTTGCVNNMTGYAIVTINPAPTAYTVTGGGGYCVGTGGVHVGLTSSNLGINYQLYRGGSPVGSVVAGTGFVLDFGLETIGGIYSVSAVNATTGCTNLMSGTATVTANPLPTAYAVTGGGSYCAGSGGADIVLLGSDVGISYKLYDPTSIVVNTQPGTGSAIDFGNQTTAGTYTIVGTNTSTGCVSNMSGNPVITINPLPVVHNVTGGGGYCAGGTGVHIGLDISNTGINYQLFSGVSAVSGVIPGTGSAIDFGLQTAAGTYTVLATDATTSCYKTMNGIATVTVNSLPTVYNVTGGGHYCAGGTGVHVYLDGSASGISYQLYKGGIADGSALPGTGSSLDFGLKTASGIYTVVATNTSTSCVNYMNSSATVSIDPLPVAYNVTGGGGYCSGGTGVHVGLGNSATGITYALYNGITLVSSMTGTGSAIDFGLQTAAGSYSVVATNTTTGCINQMTGAATVVINPLPTAYAVTGGGHYCAGGTGVHVTLNGSDIGISYQLYYNAGLTGSPVAGTGGVLDFGLQTSDGAYTIVATNTTTGCVSNMTGSATVTIDPLPGAITGTTSVCVGSTTMLSDAGGGTWTSGNTTVAGIGSSSGMVTGITAGTATIIYRLSTGCSASAIVTVNPLPSAFAVTGGGAYCAGGAGVHIGLSGSVSGVNYQLYNGAATVGSLYGGTGLSIDFGIQATAGTYSVLATNATTGCSSVMSGNVAVTVNPLPTVFSVTGGGSFCAGGAGMHVGLNGSQSGVNYQLYNGSSPVGAPVGGTAGTIDFGLQTAAGTYSVSAVNATTGCTSSMTGNAIITVNPLPTVYTVTGGGTYCAGGAGYHIGLSLSQTGVNYQLYNGSATVGGVVAGTGSALDFGTMTAAGTYSVSAVNATTGCSSNMNGSANIVVNPLPSVYNVTGGGDYCAGGTGVHVKVSGSNTGINYQLYYNGTSTGSAMAGTGANLDFGLQTAAGIYSAYAIDAVTGCTVNMTGSVTVTVDPLPLAYTVTGGGSYCAGGSGFDISLNGSQSGVSYKLYNGGGLVTTVAGTGSSIDFGIQTTAGTYTVLATNTTTGCMNSMTGSATITVNSLPTVYAVTGGGSYCSGGTGVLVGLGNSDIGVSYQLYNGLATVGSPVNGTGAAISFGLQTGSGVYTVIATNGSACTANMSGSATVSVNYLPAVYTTLGGGSYCMGGAGVDVYLSNSDGGISYQLYDNGATVGVGVPGTGSLLHFGLQTAAGSYTVVATNSTTGCISGMNGNPAVTVDPLPNVYTVTGGGGYCPGGSGVVVGLSGSQSGTTYQLYVNGNPAGGTVSGTGSALNFGLQTVTGNYTVIATNPATHCTSSMTGSVNVVINPVPTIYTMTGTAAYCSGDTGVHVGLNGSDTGINYQLYWNGNPVGSAHAGINAPLDFGLQTIAGAYTSIATNATTGCTSSMAASAIVSINPLPVVDTISAGGHYCSGGTGVDITLGSSNTGISYQLYWNGNPVGYSLPGTGGVLDFGSQTGGGNYTIIGTNTTTNCSNMMWGTAVVTIDPLPTQYTVSSGGSYCSGGSGVNITLSWSDVGINYQLYNSTGAVGSALPGNGNVLNFGMQTVAGTYSVVATNTSTGCVKNMTGTATVMINPLPVVYAVGGGGSYCPAGSGVHITLAGSDTGMSYQLYRGSTAVGGTLLGTGLALDFGLQTAVGTYSVSATNNATGCMNGMSGGATVATYSLPVAYAVAPGGSYCAGGAGVHVILSGSDTGISYQLYNGATGIGSPIAGNGSALDFGAQTTPGFYTVIGTSTTTHCSSNMTGTSVISVNPLPTVYSVTGGGAYCSGGLGIHIGLSGSQSGIRYQLYNGYSPVGSPVGGTGSAIDFGLETATGSYAVIATNSTTSCATSMSGTPAVTTNPLPAIYTVTGGGSYCAGGTGVVVGLSSSELGVRYQLYNGSSLVGTAQVGTGAPLNFGAQTAGGNYTVIGTNVLTGCVSGMSGVATVTVNALPVIYTITGGGSYCSGGAGVHIGLNGSTYGISYQLYNGLSAAGTAVIGTGSALDLGAQAAAGTYRIIATNLSTGCTSNMTGTTTVSVNALPTVYAVIGGGSYCSGTPGVHIGLSGSQSAVTYQLYNGSTFVSSNLGTGSALDFGLTTTAGTYSVMAVNGTSCSSNMTGSATVSITPSVTPAVNIAMSTNDTICAGTAVSYSVTATNGGSSPAYQWTVNGINAGTLTTYSYTPANGDVINLTMISSAACATPSLVNASAVTMAVLPNITPAVTVSATPGTTICKGTLVTFTANPVGGGTAPVYAWLRNGTNVGSGSYYFNSPSNNDVITCVMTSNYMCRTANVAFSPNVTMTVDSATAPVVSISANPGTTIGVGQADTLTAVIVDANGGTSPVYQWYLNNGIVAGATSPRYINSNFYNLDSVSCQVTTTTGCGNAIGSAYVIIHMNNLSVVTVNGAPGDLRLLPNPNKGEFTIEGSLGTTDDEVVSIEMTDMLGQVVYKDKVTVKGGKMAQQIHVSKTLASGMYLLNLHSDTDSKVFHVVIEQ